MFFNPHMKDIMVRYHQAEQRNGFYKAKDVLPYMIVAGVVDNSGILVPHVAHDGTACSGGLVPCAFSLRPKA